MIGFGIVVSGRAIPTEFEVDDDSALCRCVNGVGGDIRQVVGEDAPLPGEGYSFAAPAELRALIRYAPSSVCWTSSEASTLLRSSGPNCNLASRGR
jgi:hypothetical protein